MAWVAFSNQSVVVHQASPHNRAGRYLEDEQVVGPTDPKAVFIQRRCGDGREGESIGGSLPIICGCFVGHLRQGAPAVRVGVMGCFARDEPVDLGGGRLVSQSS